MRKFCFLLALALLPASASNAALVITEVMSSSSVTDDWWELTNTGSLAVDLTGYYWDDNGPSGADGALFGSFIINAGQSIIISQSTEAEFSAVWGSGITVFDQSFFTGPDTFSGLGSGGDQIELWDTDPNAGPANLVANATFPAATTGFSFQWNQNGIDLGLSVAGENGAYAAGGDIGSPGVSAVPEPGSMASLAIASVAMMCYRRKKNRRQIER
jgi:hypothetical protein